MLWIYICRASGGHLLCIKIVFTTYGECCAQTTLLYQRTNRYAVVGVRDVWYLF